MNELVLGSSSQVRGRLSQHVTSHRQRGLIPAAGALPDANASDTNPGDAPMFYSAAGDSRSCASNNASRSCSSTA